MSGTEAIVGWHIRKGEHEGVSLAGVRLAAVLSADQSLSRGTPPRNSVLFIDAASDAQFQSAEAFARKRFRALLGDIIHVVRTAIRFEGAAIQIGDLLELRMRRFVIPDDPQGKRIWHEPFIPLSETILAFSVAHVYRGKEFGAQWSRYDSGTTGYFGSFVLAAR